ncbi:glycosyltransferase [Turicibacter sanguinis]|nr:glycosyltransferase [Turicibacter sanguinis]MTN85044.1 glycosyltransferase [Turicibacter sanguinis]MTN87822.1 glycosyltransferase [Turicibacter sanguinis]MTN90676.1 glycosyltransferase [Turicibacter sanguinis]MTN93911.1 glycosyltransferase [Turicibacter sanguinis]
MGNWFGGGVEAVVMNYYRNIDRTKIQFDFFCSEESTDIPYKEIESMGGKVVLIPSYSKLIKYQKELKRIFTEGNYQIVHSHISTMSIFPLRVATKVGIPIRIAHSHSTTSIKEKKKNIMKQILRNFSKIYANNYFCCSELAGRWLFGNRTYDDGKVFLVNNAIDLTKFTFNSKIRKEKRIELGIDDDTLVIGHIGRFVKQKNHDFLIDIFNEIHMKNENSLLFLAGQGPLQNELSNKVKELKLENSVKFLGQRSDTNDLYQAFDIFLLPSLYEGLPVVGIEAQASGLLCVFSNNVTKETKILKSTQCIPLSFNEKKWSEIILDSYNVFLRSECSDEIAKKGFNIKDEAIKLERKYYQLIQMQEIKI